MFYEYAFNHVQVVQALSKIPITMLELMGNVYLGLLFYIFYRRSLSSRACQHKEGNSSIGYSSKKPTRKKVVVILFFVFVLSYYME